MKTNWFVTISKYMMVFLGLLVFYLLFGVMACLLPNEPIRSHIQKTLLKGDLVEEEHYAFSKAQEYSFDNTTDSHILNQAFNGGRKNPLETALLVPSSVKDTNDMIENLAALVSGREDMSEMHYGRYWHGSTFLMRFLLSFNDYVRIRKLLCVISSLLLVVIYILLSKRKGLCFSLIYCFSWTVVNVFMMQNSIQYFSVLMISLVGTLFVLLRSDKPVNLCMLLFLTGSFASYFDLLTCPILTWGVPLCTYFIVYPQQSLRMGIKTWTHSSLLWVLGYSLTFVSKFVIATIVTDENVIEQGMAAVAERAGEFGSITRWDSVICNLHMVNWHYVAAFLLVLIVLACLKFRRDGLVNSVLCFISIVPPLAWFAVLSNHSFIHKWFVYRDCAVIVLAMLSAVALLVDWNRLDFRFINTLKRTK